MDDPFSWEPDETRPQFLEPDRFNDGKLMPPLFSTHTATPPITELTEEPSPELSELIKRDLDIHTIRISFKHTPEGAEGHRRFSSNRNRATARLCQISLRHPILLLAEQHGWHVDHNFAHGLNRFWLRVSDKPTETLESLLQRQDTLSETARDYLHRSIDDIERSQGLTPVEQQDNEWFVIRETLRLDGLATS